jgi:hypothetical protein
MRLCGVVLNELSTGIILPYHVSYIRIQHMEGMSNVDTIIIV